MNAGILWLLMSILNRSYLARESASIRFIRQLIQLGSVVGHHLVPRSRFLMHFGLIKKMNRSINLHLNVVSPPWSDPLRAASSAALLASNRSRIHFNQLICIDSFQEIISSHLHIVIILAPWTLVAIPGLPMNRAVDRPLRAFKMLFEMMLIGRLF